MRRITVAIVGLSFGMEFVPIYRDHPGVGNVYVCDRNKDLTDRSNNCHGMHLLRALIVSQ